MTKMLMTLVCAGALLFALDTARAAEPGGGAAGSKAGEGAKSKAGESETGKPEEGGAGKPDEGGPDEGAEGPPGGKGGPVSLAELTRDGFVIRTTDFIPGDAVTRQSGKLSADAVIVTLQKTTSTAVCFYTLKAYVGKKLSTIAACTIHQ